MSTLQTLLGEIRRCDLCAAHLPLRPRPVLAVHEEARILIVGQAPGRKVHASGVPWDDASGDRLRAWLGVDREIFYDPRLFAIVPMGFCYPGTGASGDLPPRPECAPRWHSALLAHLPRVELTLLLSRHAQSYYLGSRCLPTLAETVRAFEEVAPGLFPLPHPSPRNNRWLKSHPWFEAEVLPVLAQRVRRLVTPAREDSGAR